MAYSIAHVARLAKVTSRTLRHYDEIGLLPPAYLGGNGYRYYEEEQLLRLQQILVLRELGLGLEKLEGGKPVNAEELYTGIGRHSEEARHLAEEAEQRWPGSSETYTKVKGWSDEKWQAVQRQGAEATDRLAELMRQGIAPDDPRAVEAVDAHYRWVCHFWTPNREAYTGLGRLYVDDSRFTENFDRIAPGLAAYVSAAMAAYAQDRLS
ncbi:MerR family transcriptional regulator [Prauserella oleivorans]|uniref:MerR family transcriptional regulator n=1 Tax=Prauserella oleivorans TaxID=1478153 RepID=A0ABW5W5M1_9PSEU